MVSCMDHIVHDSPSVISLIDRPCFDRAIPQVTPKSFHKHVAALVSGHCDQICPIDPAPPSCEHVQVFLGVKCSFEPAICKEIEYFYLMTRLFKLCKLLHC